jgi:hypothetical protein
MRRRRSQAAPAPASLSTDSAKFDHYGRLRVETDQPAVALARGLFVEEVHVEVGKDVALVVLL